jgi:hypothetical protein
MSLADSNRAIGAVTRLISDHLISRTGLVVSVGRPEDAASGGGSLRLNLFLYETEFDGHMKNVSVEEDRLPPLWLVLRYLLTPFDVSGHSDSIEAHMLLGRGLSALSDLSYVPLNAMLPPEIRDALSSNPENLKLTFDEANPELLSKVLQGGQDRYRISAAFHVRPVMIAPPEPPDYSLLVGIDYTKTPPAPISPDRAVGLDLLPSLGPELYSVSPTRFETGSTIELTGRNLSISGLDVWLGSARLTITMQTDDRLACEIDGSIALGRTISPGSLPLVATETLPSGKRRKSNIVVGRLLPTLTNATTSGLALNGEGRVFGTLALEGTLLGTSEDDVVIALYREGAVTAAFDTAAAVPDQAQLVLSIPTEQAVEPGEYRIILRTNGQQATNSPSVSLVV